MSTTFTFFSPEKPQTFSALEKAERYAELLPAKPQECFTLLLYLRQQKWDAKATLKLFCFAVVFVFEFGQQASCLPPKSIYGVWSDGCGKHRD